MKPFTLTRFPLLSLLVLHTVDLSLTTTYQASDAAAAVKAKCTEGLLPDRLHALLDPDDLEIEDFEYDEAELSKYQMPEGYDFHDCLRNISNEGSGYYMIKKIFSKEDVHMAQDMVARYKVDPSGRKKLNSSEFVLTSEDHNNFSGLLWGLVNRGRIFEKLATHPVILELSKELLGPSAQISSLASNTVLPGMPAQTPHLDYPYYDFLFPERSDAMHTNQLLALQFVTLLTDFTVENGGTAIRPHSHWPPTFPSDIDEFHRNAIQVVGEAGDMIVFAGPIQHCAMANKSGKIRSGILQHMAPAYIKPFESMWAKPEVAARATPELRKILGLDHPYPANKQKRKN